MSSTTDDRVCEHCRAAVATLDRVLEERPDKIHDEIVDAVGCVVRLRDNLIEQRRAGDTSRRLQDQLDHANAVLSVMAGGVYPLVGVRWQRVEQARDELKRLLADTTTT